MDKYKKLAGNSFIYFLGTIGSKIVSLIMVSFYSFMLTAEEYGKIDITQTTISLILPILTLCIHEALLRFSLKNKELTDDYLSSSFVLVTGFSFISIPICFLLSSINIICGNVFIVSGVIIFEGLNTLISQFAKSVGKNKLYASSGVIATFVIAALNILFLRYLNLKIDGYFIATLIGYFISFIVLVFGSGFFKHFRFKKVNKKILLTMLAFSIPLIPNSLMWFLNNSADKYVILGFLGEEANGIYAVASKLPTMLSILSTIFMEAWLVSAISECDSHDNSIFFSNVFEILSGISCVIISCLLIFLRPLLSFVINSSYTDVWRYVPFLLMSSLASFYASFYGTVYTAFGKTKRILFTAFIGASTNIVFNLIFVNFFGLNGVALGTCLSFLIMFFTRIFDTKSIINIKIDAFKFLLSLFLTIIQCLLIFVFDPISYSKIGFVFLFLLLLINYPYIKKMFTLIFKKGREENL